MTDNIGEDPPARKAGRGLTRLLRGLFGRKRFARTRESWQVLKREYRAGRASAEEDPEPPPRRIPHKEK